MTIFKELRRRNVFKVASVYLITSWLVLQIIAVVSPYLHLPSIFGTGVTIILLIALPFACIMAWAFELTPDGIKRTHEVDDDDSIRHITGRKINTALILGLFASLAFISYQQYSITHTSNKIIKIAVLPFDDMSHDSSQQYFGDGIAEEILNSLAKVKALHVTARTSSFTFKNKENNIKEIGQILGINYILEGSVRKSGNTLRVTAQLINAKTGYHLWSETYDRPLTDIFAIQDELTIAITKALKVTLMPAEQQQIAERTTDNVEAYELYIKANTLLANRNASNVKQAIESLEKALKLDANFGKAKAKMFLALMSAKTYLGLSTKVIREKNKAIFDELIVNNQNFSEKYLIIGLYLVIYSKNYQASEQALTTALAINNSNVSALRYLSTYQTPKEAIATVEKAMQLNPLDLDNKTWAISSYLDVDNTQRATALLTEMERINETSYLTAIMAYDIFYIREKNISQALAYLQKSKIKHNRISEYLLVELYLANGDIDDAIALIQEKINGYPHDGILAELVTTILLTQKQQLFTEQQQQTVNNILNLLPEDLQQTVMLDINLITGNHQTVLADKALYQALLLKADTLSAVTYYKDNVLIDAAFLFAQYGKVKLLDKVMSSIKHLVPWCQIKQMRSEGCPQILYYYGVIDNKQKLLTHIKKKLNRNYYERNRYLTTDARYIMLQEMPEFQQFSKDYVATFF